MSERDTVFSTNAFRFVDIILGSIAVATVLVTAMNILLSAVNANPPLAFLALIAKTVVGIGLALLMIVMRMLLVQATALRSELSEVV